MATNLDTDNDSETFSVEVCSDDFKFSCGHFVAYQGYRERLHGHNYTVSLKLVGNAKLNHDGYVADFTLVKAAVRAACKSLNEHLIVPGKSDVLSFRKRTLYEINGPNTDSSSIQAISESDSEWSASKSQRQQFHRNIAPETGIDPYPNLNLDIKTEDGSFFSLPYCDVKILPIIHTTAEEFAHFLWWDIVRRLGGFNYLSSERSIVEMSLSVAERPTQRGTFSRKFGNKDESLLKHHMKELERFSTPDGWLDNSEVNYDIGEDNLKQYQLDQTVGVAVSDIVILSDMESGTDSNSQSQIESQNQNQNQDKDQKKQKSQTQCNDIIQQQLVPKTDADYQMSRLTSAIHELMDAMSQYRYPSESQAQTDSTEQSDPFFDLNSDSLIKTPERAAKSWIELTRGYRESLSKVVNSAFFEIQSETCLADLNQQGQQNDKNDLGNINQNSIPMTIMSNPNPNPNHYPRLITISDINFSSVCEHHLLPFSGKAHVGVVVEPYCRVLGLSKYARIVEMYSKRLQVQERLTDQICDAVWSAYLEYGIEKNTKGSESHESQIQNQKDLQKTGILGAGVLLTNVDHSCMSCRGSRVQGSKTHTSAYRGVLSYPENAWRREFREMVMPSSCFINPNSNSMIVKNGCIPCETSSDTVNDN